MRGDYVSALKVERETEHDYYTLRGLYPKRNANVYLTELAAQKQIRTLLEANLLRVRERIEELEQEGGG